MRKEPLNVELVREFIIASHGNFGEVKILVADEPALIHAVFNWSSDDWESGLGAAAHTGCRVIAEWLLERGARMDIFSAAMLGELNIVKAMIESRPDLLEAKGPHGIPLVRHAQMGGEIALPVYKYIESLKQKEEIVS